MKTTKKHFKIFKKECRWWIRFFGLTGHRFHFEHGGGPQGCLAFCYFPEKHEDRVFTLGLSKRLRFRYSKKAIRRAAFHEVVEALLYRLGNLAECRYVQPEEIKDEVHNLVRILESTVFEKVRG